MTMTTCQATSEWERQDAYPLWLSDVWQKRFQHREPTRMPCACVETWSIMTSCISRTLRESDCFSKKCFISAGISTHFFTWELSCVLCVNTHIRSNIIALDAARRLSQLVYYLLSGWRAISDPSEKSLNSREPVDVSQSSTTTQHIATMDEKSYVNVD